MSDNDDNDNNDGNDIDDRASVTAVLEDADENTLRILLSTDNHLGYQEKDPIRGMDSFAAFEEVLYIAKRFECDMVLLAGDLFHDNRPSRRTMYLTMKILRKYCMGDDPVRVEVVSDPSNLRSGQVNYADENYSVDLPIFSIHGNHDDPTRDAHGELLAALDLLSVTNLVNYFGRQEEVDKVSISPVLLNKGTTQVALYGLGSLRDERLNRMWQNQKVRFLKPEDDDFFHIFALHQNRDLGRGKKNCVQESMIPEWMDIVMWGHEHECWIDFSESVVGTFRITQPGSSVATSLVSGEAVRKKVGVLDVNGSNFRMHTVPLTQVRSFVTTEIVLKEQDLDPLDAKIDFKIGKVLEQQVRVLVLEAREKRKHLLKDAVEAGNKANENENNVLQNMMQNPDQVLVRIRVDHSGFTSINNQRFGAQFVGDVANPADILLFSRKKEGGGASTATASQKAALKAMAAPIAPEELEQTNMQDIVQQFLDLPEQKLKLLNESRLSLAMEEFVDKCMTSSINDAAFNQLEKKQKKLANKSVGSVKTHSEARDLVQQDVEDASEKKKRLAKATALNDLQEDNEEEEPAPKKKGGRRKQVIEDDDDESMDELDEASPSPRKKRAPRTKSTKASEAKRKATRRQQEELDQSDDMSVAAHPKKKTSTTAASSRPRRGTATKKKRVIEIDSDDDDESEAEVVMEADDSDDDLIVDEEETKPKRKTSRKTKAAAASAKKKTPARRTGGRGRRGFASSFAGGDDSDDDDDGVAFAGTNNSTQLDDDWGTAATKSQK